MGTDFFFPEMSEKHLDFQDFGDVINLCLPGSTAPVDKIFSVKIIMWSKEKCRLRVETMRATLVG
jgi:hypothetical protein